MIPAREISPAYKRSLWTTIGVQLVLLLVGMLATDCGEWARTVLLTVVAFWIMALIVIVRRPHNPTAIDLMVIRYGYPAIFSILLFWALMRI